MEINLNSNGFSNIGVMREATNVTGIDAGQVSRPANFHVASSSLHVQSADLASSEPIMEIPDSALSRDDELGKLVSAAFNLPPPSMPNFASL